MDDARNELRQAFADAKAADTPTAAPEPISPPESEKQPNTDQNNPSSGPSLAATPEPTTFFKLREERKKETRERERIERERDLAFDRLRELEARQGPAVTPVNKNLLSDDAIPDGKMINLLVQRLEDQERRLEEYSKRSAQVTTEVALRSEMSDFATVVTEENLELLKEQEPEMYEALDSSSSKYTAQKAAYKAIKRFILPPPVPVDTGYDMDKRKLAENSQKPRSTSSLNPTVPNKSALSLAAEFGGVMTPEEKNKWQIEMYAARRRTGM